MGWRTGKTTKHAPSIRPHFLSAMLSWVGGLGHGSCPVAVCTTCRMVLTAACLVQACWHS